jgi:hypothetical protein
MYVNLVRELTAKPETNLFWYFVAAYSYRHCFLGALVKRAANRSAGLTSIARDFYRGGRHEMLHELNRCEVVANVLAWISGILERAS